MSGSIPYEEYALVRLPRAVWMLVFKHSELEMQVGLRRVCRWFSEHSTRFVFTLRDAADLAREAGIDVVLDLYSCWYERDLEALVRDNVDLIAAFIVASVKRAHRDDVRAIGQFPGVRAV